MALPLRLDAGVNPGEHGFGHGPRLEVLAPNSVDGLRVHVGAVRLANARVREVHLVHPVAAERNRLEVAAEVLLDQPYLGLEVRG